MRLKLLSVVSEYANNDALNETTRIRLTWNRIKRNPLVKPTVKRYLADNVRGTFRRIDADEMMLDPFCYQYKDLWEQERHRCTLILEEWVNNQYRRYRCLVWINSLHKYKERAKVSAYLNRFEVIVLSPFEANADIEQTDLPHLKYLLLQSRQEFKNNTK